MPHPARLLFFGLMLIGLSGCSSLQMERVYGPGIDTGARCPECITADPMEPGPVEPTGVPGAESDDSGPETVEVRFRVECDTCRVTWFAEREQTYEVEGSYRRSQDVNWRIGSVMLRVDPLSNEPVGVATIEINGYLAGTQTADKADEGGSLTLQVQLPNCAMDGDRRCKG